jgi:hypothetical protein
MIIGMALRQANIIVLAVWQSMIVGMDYTCHEIRSRSYKV